MDRGEGASTDPHANPGTGGGDGPEPDGATAGASEEPVTPPGESGEPSDPRSLADALPSDPLERVIAAYRRRPLWQVVAGVVVLALLARVVFLGARTAHWDEARVAHWIVHYEEFGAFAYRRIIHGPFVQHLNRQLFALFGRSDFVMRLPVAVVGALLPATAYLFREHLDRDEAVAMALFLAANSVLLYYSRFMRSDLFVATFMFAAFGTLVRFYDTRRVRYLYATGALAALGFAAKENAVIYLLVYLGATVLLVDIGLHRPHTYRSGWARIRGSRIGRRLALLALAGVTALASGLLGFAPLLGSTLLGLGAGGALGAGVFAYGLVVLGRRDGADPRRLGRRYGRYLGHLVGVGALVLGITVFMFAPRGQGLAGIYLNEVTPRAEPLGRGLYAALGDPLSLPGYCLSVLGYAVDQFSAWFGAATDSGQGETVFDVWIEFLGLFLRVLLYNAAPLSIFALLGFVWERYARDHARNLVMFASYIALVSVVGYPLGTDIFGAWIVVHALVPMAIPAGVGVAHVARWARSAARYGDPTGAAVLGGLALAGIGGVGYSLTWYAGGLDPDAAVVDPVVFEAAAGVGLVTAGVVSLVRRDIRTDADTAVTGVVAAVLVLFALQTGAVSAADVYEEPAGAENPLVQFAQPADLNPVTDRIDTVAPAHANGTDVLIYTDENAQPPPRNDFLNRPEPDGFPKIFRPLCTDWVETLPLNWYLVRAEANTACATGVEELPTADPVPVIVAPEGNLELPSAMAEEYATREHRFRKNGQRIEVFVHEDWQRGSERQGA